MVRKLSKQEFIDGVEDGIQRYSNWIQNPSKMYLQKFLDGEQIIDALFLDCPDWSEVIIIPLDWYYDEYVEYFEDENKPTIDEMCYEIAGNVRDGDWCFYLSKTNFAKSGLVSDKLS